MDAKLIQFGCVHKVGLSQVREFGCFIRDKLGMSYAHVCL